MIRYKRNKAKVKKFYMKGKPIKMGFKLYAVCDHSGYILGFNVHENIRGQKIKDLAMKVPDPFPDVWHCIYTDRYYSSVDLAEALLARNTNFCGSIRTNRQRLATKLSSKPEKAGCERAACIKNMHKTARGMMYFRQNGDLTYTLWKDSKVLSILSTCHQAYRDKTSDTQQR